MSYERRVTIMDGIELSRFSRDDFELLFNDFVSNFPEHEILKRCSSYFLMNVKDITFDEFEDYLHDNDILLDCEFLDYIYIGERILEIGEDTESFAREIETLPAFPKIPAVTFNFIKDFFPSHHIHRFIINWAL